MKGLLIKDLINLKKQGMIIGVLIVFYAVLGFWTHDSSMMGAVMAVLAAMMPITSMAYDEKAKWDKYALSMPVSRRDIVLGKYLLGILFSAVVFIVNIAFNLIVNNGESLKEIALLSGALSGLALVYMALVMPVLFRFGVEKGRLLMMMLLFGATGLIVYFSTNSESLPSAQTLNLAAKLSPSIVIAVLLTSFLLSSKIYEKREL
ncbi:MAG: ABC-2 transporter permease [Eubacteriales bacterium]|nr:ABC-2 transporter permease [Eubacteriales bacterium]MDD3349251.1 ABC-2 transporter permease [Eubacteriales bacterium]